MTFTYQWSCDPGSGEDILNTNGSVQFLGSVTHLAWVAEVGDVPIAGDGVGSSRHLIGVEGLVGTRSSWVAMSAAGLRVHLILKGAPVSRQQVVHPIEDVSTSSCLRRNLTTIRFSVCQCFQLVVLGGIGVSDSEVLIDKATNLLILRLQNYAGTHCRSFNTAFLINKSGLRWWSLCS